MTEPESVAAVDFGSNSFHLLVARVTNGVPTIVDRLREPIQLASGLDDEGRLTRRARQRALECIERFGQRLRNLAPHRVRAVGTSALREAKNAREFLAEAERALGHPIEVVAGREEARLIYLGVSHNLKDEPGRRLVVDIGGGSTECILGERFEPLLVDSLEMGCIGFSRRYFPGGAIRRRRYDEAVLAARLEVRGAAARFRELGWQGAVGSSGTISAVEQALRGSGWSDGGITARGLGRLVDRIVDLGHVDRLDLPGLKEERRPVLPGGLAILQAVFEGFGLDRMETSYGALREGVLFDLLGRLQHEDARDRTIRAFEERYHADRAQAERVEKAALAFLEQVAGTWKLDREEGARFLSWAARLHEIGAERGHAGLLEGRPGAARDAHRDAPEEAPPRGLPPSVRADAGDGDPPRGAAAARRALPQEPRRDPAARREAHGAQERARRRAARGLARQEPADAHRPRSRSRAPRPPRRGFPGQRLTCGGGTTRFRITGYAGSGAELVPQGMGA